MGPALLDTDTLSEVMKGRDPHVREKARQYLATYGRFTFSIITRYEILRGLKVKSAAQQLAAFAERCRHSHLLQMTDDVIIRGQPISMPIFIDRVTSSATPISWWLPRPWFTT